MKPGKYQKYYEHHRDHVKEGYRKEHGDGPKLERHDPWIG